MQSIIKLSVICSAIALLAPVALGEMVVFENTNPALNALAIFDPNGGDGIFGQALDVTSDAFNQPSIGALPGGSLVIMHVSGFFGESTWLGTGMLTQIVRADEPTMIPDPFAGQLVPYYGPENFSDGELISAGNEFVDGWRPLHVLNDLTPEKGSFTIGESFTVGVRFERTDGEHYGFARFERSYEFIDNRLSVSWHPIEWGYETIAGVGASVVPAPGAVPLVMVSALGCSFMIRRRRPDRRRM